MEKQIDSILLDITIKTMESSLSRIYDKIKKLATYIATPGDKSVDIIIKYIRDIRCEDSDTARFSISLREAGVNEGYISLLAPQPLRDISLGFNNGVSSGFNNGALSSLTRDSTAFHQEILDLVNEFLSRNDERLKILKTIRRKYNGRKNVQ